MLAIVFPSLMPLKCIISSASQVWGNSFLVDDISSVWHFTRSGRRPALPQGVHSLVHTEPTCFRYNLWGHGSMRSLPPCDLQLYILINCFHLKGSFGKKKKEKKGSWWFYQFWYLALGPTMYFQLLNIHDSLLPQVQEEEPGKQPGRTRWLTIVYS